MSRFWILGVLLLSACSSAEPPLMIDGSHSRTASADGASADQPAAAAEDGERR